MLPIEGLLGSTGLCSDMAALRFSTVSQHPESSFDVQRVSVRWNCMRLIITQKLSDAFVGCFSLFLLTWLLKQFRCSALFVRNNWCLAGSLQTSFARPATIYFAVFSSWQNYCFCPLVRHTSSVARPPLWPIYTHNSQYITLVQSPLVYAWVALHLFRVSLNVFVGPFSLSCCLTLVLCLPGTSNLVCFLIP